jgi:hypothetical protein
VGVAGEGVDDKNRVLTSGVQLTPGLVGEHDISQATAKFRLKLTYTAVKSARLGRSLPSPGPRV